jgi:hypothetical protein
MTGSVVCSRRQGAFIAIQLQGLLCGKPALYSAQLTGQIKEIKIVSHAYKSSVVIRKTVIRNTYQMRFRQNRSDNSHVVLPIQNYLIITGTS